jgi:oxygen-independent coproporphyrinogen-3 oxidase
VVRARHIYVHVPFCGRRCSYCDFAIAVRRVVPVEEYASALERELSLRFPAGGENWVADTLYLGGGTPSRLGPDGVSRVLDVLRQRITMGGDAEVTLEANPDDVTPAAASSWRSAGVNRLSIGAQSFDDQVLAWMHRTHDAATIGRAVDAARAAGIENLSLDLIFALPENVERSWERDVARAVDLEPAHLSLYGLTIEPHTPLGRWRDRGQVAESPDERYEREFLYAHAALSDAGFDHYEVSNFGRPGFHSRHNSAYWACVAYAGLGPSAHEFDGTRRRWNATAYAAWLARVDSGDDPIESSEELNDDNRVAEEVYLGLRTTRGLALSGVDIARVRPWIEAGWASLSPIGRLVLSPQGWLRLDALATDLTVFRSRY